MLQFAGRVALVVALSSIGTAAVAQGRGGAGAVGPPQTPAAPVPGVINLNAPPTAAGTGAISGVVVDADSGAPLAGVMVYLGPPQHGPGDEPIRQFTDAKGRFVFMHLAAFSGYFLQASKFGYFEGYYGRASSGQLGARIGVADGEWVRDLRIPMTKSGAIEGVVLDERGQPVVGAYVRALRRLRIAGEMRLTAANTTTTDDRGAYRLSGLRAGSYFVEVPSVQTTVPAETPDNTLAGVSDAALAAGQAAGVDRSFKDAMVDVAGNQRVLAGRYPAPTPSADGRRRVYPPTFYPNASTLEAATAIDLTGSDARSGVDLRLAAASTSRISGRVEGPPASFAGMTLRLVLEGVDDLGNGFETATSLIGRDGTFVFADVPPGAYAIEASRIVGGYQSVVTFTPTASVPSPPATATSSIGSYGVYTGAESSSFSYQITAGDNWFGRAAIHVEGRDVADVVVPMHRGASLSGRIVYEGARPAVPDSLGPGIAAQPANGDASLGIVRSRNDGPDHFVMEGLRPGAYVLTATFARMKSFVCGDRDYAFAAFDATNGADVSDCVVTMTSARTVLSGHARASTSGPMDAAAIVFPVEREQWTAYGFNPVRLKAVEIGAGGAFQFQSLPAGDYYVIAVPGDLVYAWQDPKFLETAAGLATKCHIDWGGTATVDLELQSVKWER